MTIKTTVCAQRIALTTNMLEDVVLTPNIGVDLAVADRHSLSMDLSCSPYKLTRQFYNKSLAIRGGYKYWLSQAFYAHYVGLDLVASSTEFSMGPLNFRGEYVGLGIGYGYSFILNERFNIVPSIGVGIAYGPTYEGYDHMTDIGQGIDALATFRFMPMITRFAITIQYVLN